MRVLYIDVVGLLYSKRYLESHEVFFDDLKFTISYQPMSITDSLPHDAVSARLLEKAVSDASLKIYPVEPFRSYKWVRDQEVFSPASLAPDIDWRGKLRMGSGGTTARTLLHAENLGVKQGSSRIS
ncbi:hypothetical protein AB4249_21810, partial [Vibrio sp. 10N.261.55.F4]|uniref:hypothetical protein n=1 Tax=Vibrio sp. 10N.261.55.F4 TaxID=3229692 RepID=UPI0035535E15